MGVCCRQGPRCSDLLLEKTSCDTQNKRMAKHHLGQAQELKTFEWPEVTKPCLGRVKETSQGLWFRRLRPASQPQLNKTGSINE